MTSQPFSAAFIAPRYWPTWLGLGLLWLLSWLPAGWRRGLGRYLGHRLLGRNTKRREIVMTNLGWCLPELEAQHEALADSFFSYTGQVMLDLGFFWWASRRRLLEQIEIEGEEHLQKEIAAGRPVLLVSPHVLPLDFGALTLSIHHDRAFFMAHTGRNLLLDWFLTHRRCRFGASPLTRDSNLRPVMRGMRDGSIRIIYIIIDEDLGEQGSVFAPFFGVPKATLLSPMRMARISGASVIPVVTLYRPERGRYVLRLMPPLEDFPGTDDLVDGTRINAALEAMIRQAPEQYMWSLRLFQTRPDGSPPPYRMKGKPGSGPRPRPDTSGTR